MLSPAERSLIGRAGAYRLHSRYDSRVLSQPARDKFMSRFEVEVDPDGKLPIAERARRADMAKRAYFLELSRKSAQARRKTAEGRKRKATQ